LYLSKESFSERALRALNISTTTSTVMATVMGALLLKASHPLVHLEELSRSPHDICGPFCTHRKGIGRGHSSRSWKAGEFYVYTRGKASGLQVGTDLKAQAAQTSLWKQIQGCGLASFE